MHRKLSSYILIIGLFTLIIITVIMLKRVSIQTCTYQDELRKIAVDIPKKWTFKVNNKFKGNESTEGFPDCGIEIYIDGDTQNKFYLFYQEGTINFREPGMLAETFKTNKGQSGSLYTVFNNNKTRIFAIFDIGHYAITSELDNNLFSVNEKEILSMIKSICIIEF
jgi:hypothetical protein